MQLYQGWIYRCVDLRSKAIAKVDWKLYQMKKNGEVEEVLEHELLDLLYKFNPGTTKFDGVELTVTYLDIFGGAPWYLADGDKGKKPTAIYTMRPENLKAKRDKEGRIIGWEYQIGNYKREYGPEEVINLKNYNPTDPEKGLGIIEAVRLTAQNEDYIQQHNNNLLKNGGRPSGALVVEGKLGDKEYKRLKKQTRDEFGGYDQAGKIHLFEGGAKWQDLSITPKDLDFIQAREMNRDEIAGIFGVPKSLLGFTDANRASAATAEYIFAKWTLEPYLTKILEQLNEFLVPRFGDNLWLGFEPLAQKDEQVENARREKAVNLYMTVNEVRAEIGLKALKGGDNLYMGMANMPFMSDEGQDKKKGIELEGKAIDALKVDAKTAKTIKKRILNRNVRLKNAAEKAAENVVNGLIQRKNVVLRLVPEKKEVSDEQREAFYKRRMADEGQLESMWEKAMTAMFEKQQERFLSALDNKKDVATDYGIDVKEEMKTTINIISPLIYETVKNGTLQAEELIGESAIFDMDFIKSWIDKVSEETGKSITNTTIEAFEKTMKTGIEAGESLGELKNRVEEVFEFAKGTRATLIARTETARGVAEAHRKMYEHYGFEDVKWLLSPGACEICQEKAKSDWTVKSIEGEIPVHPSCKCDYVPA